MSNPLPVVVGLGANLGPRRRTLQSAVTELRALSVPAAPFRISSLFETEPVGPAQPMFLNAAVLLSVALKPLDLLDRLQAIEHRHGRVRDVHWGPRTLDLDVLWIDGVAVDHARLRVPHPELPHRAFALLPLLEVRPDALTPEGQPLEAIAAFLSPGGITRVEGPEWGMTASEL